MKKTCIEWYCRIGGKTDSKDDLLIRSVNEQRDVVLLLFEGIKGLNVFNLGMKQGPLPHDKGQMVTESYQVFNIYNGVKVATMVRTTANFDDSPSVIEWKVWMRHTAFANTLVRILLDKYPDSTFSLGTNEIKTSINPLSSFTITPSKELVVSTISLIHDIENIVESMNCVMLMLKPESYGDSIEKRYVTRYAIFMLQDEYMTEILYIEHTLIKEGTKERSTIEVGLYCADDIDDEKVKSFAKGLLEHIHSVLTKYEDSGKLDTPHDYYLP